MMEDKKMGKGSGTTRTITSRSSSGSDIVAGGYNKAAIDNVINTDELRRMVSEARDSKSFEKATIQPRDKPYPASMVTVSGESGYKFATGKSPRGKGTWSYEIGDIVINTPRMSYSDSKNLAKKVAGAYGYRGVKLLS